MVVAWRLVFLKNQLLGVSWLERAVVLLLQPDLIGIERIVHFYLPTVDLFQILLIIVVHFPPQFLFKSHNLLVGLLFLFFGPVCLPLQLVDLVMKLLSLVGDLLPHLLHLL